MVIGTGKIGKWLSDKIWQTAQIKDIVSIPLWALTLTGVYYPIILNWFIENSIEIHGHVLFLGILGVTMLFFAVVGLIYDRKLKFWIHRRDTDVERNQYHNYKLMPIQVKLWKNQLNGMKAINEIAKALKIPEAEKHATKQVKTTEHWIKTGDVP